MIRPAHVANTNLVRENMRDEVINEALENRGRVVHALQHRGGGDMLADI